MPDIKFFNMGEFTINGRKVRALRHGMVGQPGWEVFGPWAEGEEVRAAILEAGKEFGLRAGGRARVLEQHAGVRLDSVAAAGRVHRRQDESRTANGCRRTSYEGIASLGGSFYSNDIEDYYLTPYDLGYGSIVKFDHDFIGRDALEKIAEAAAQEDDARLERRRCRARFRLAVRRRAGCRAKYMDLPSAVYST